MASLFFFQRAKVIRIIKEKGSIRYYAKPGWNNLIRVDYHGSKEVPKGTCHAILKDAGVQK
ncbi:MAG: type II toxin-antitoxin system HicA family toxin [Deltaproteobacteria bacterium]|nr:type II toxin-antitoxin system HicA family toxin [Deltaproteobacteria bacterium]